MNCMYDYIFHVSSKLTLDTRHQIMEYFYATHTLNFFLYKEIHTIFRDILIANKDKYGVPFK